MKGQIWTTDFVTSLIIFSLMVGIVIFAWNYTIQSSNDQVNLNILENDVLMISDTLLRVPGLPQDWNESNVRVIGLADKENVLNETKIIRFVDMDYNKTKSVLGISNREFYFEMRYPNNTVIDIGGKSLLKGTNPVGQNVQVIVPVERYGILNGNVVKMEFFLWF